MNKKQSIANYIYSKLQEAKKISTEGKPAKIPKPKTPKAKKPSTEPKPAAPHWLDSPEHAARRQERRLMNARLAHRSLRAEFAALSPEEQEKQEPEFEKQFQYWRDSVTNEQQYIADFVENLLTEQSAKEQEAKRNPVVHTNAAGREFKQRHIDRAVGHHELWDEGETGSLEHIFDARYDHSTGHATNIHTGEKLPDHISELWDDRRERGRVRGSMRRAHEKHAEDTSLEPPQEDEEPPV